jgi:hypothetical protein
MPTLRRTALAVSLAAALVGVANAPAMGARAPAADALARAHWSFSEVGAPPTQLIDDSGTTPPNNGAPQGGVIGNGDAYAFDGTGRVIVPNASSLNPGTADFSFTVILTTTLPAPKTDYDVMRKGLASTKGGEYKVEIVNASGKARAFCLVKDSAKHLASIRAATKTLADGAMHTVTCAKNATGVTITVDNTTATKNAPGGLGSVSNTANLSIGAKAEGGDDFIGTILDATVV